MAEDLQKANILIVDDTEQNVRLLDHVLKREGYATNLAYSGEEALAKVEGQNPEIILLDVMMPDMNGFEVCEKLKEKESSRDIPVIFLSALSEIDSKVKGFDVGGVDYITKPFQREEVLARIDLHLRLKRLEKELKIKIEELKEREHRLDLLNKRKDDLMRIVGHDIRNPVTGIIGLTGILKEDFASMSDDDLKQMFATIEDSGKRLLKLVNDLLKKEQAESNIAELKLQKVNVHDLIKDVIELHRPTALKKSISFHLDIKDPVELELDEQKMGQVMGNLISNALKFTSEGGKISIEVTTRQPDSGSEQVQIKVSDDGIGIPSDKLENLLNFDEQDMDSIRRGTHGEEGSGMGLKIIDHFTRLHGGELVVESEEGEGTEFTIKLPVN